jgi:integrase
MASIQQRGSSWQVRIKHKLLPSPLFATLDSETEARAYAEQIEALLKRGIVPMELLEDEKAKRGPGIDKTIAAYISAVDVAPSDMVTLASLIKEVGLSRTTDVNARWCDEWVKRMKLVENRAPGSLRKRVGSLARVLDWYIRSTLKDGATAPANPLRMMPRGYSQYTAAEAADLVSVGKAAKKDSQRDRRMSDPEYARVVNALAGGRRVGRERPLTIDPDFSLLFELIVNTGLRLSEAFKLRVDQIDLSKGVIRVEGSKGERGRLKPRVVPLAPALRPVMQAHCAERVGLIFPFWDGSKEDQSKASNRLSNRFTTVFSYAQVEDFTEHDLRHEATCRWVTMRDKSGRWMWSEVEICKILGWTDTRMFIRYASLRGEDLADRMLG